MRASNYDSSTNTDDGTPWVKRSGIPTLPNGRKGFSNIKDVIDGNELPGILHDLPQKLGAPAHASQPELVSGIQFFKSYDLPSAVEDDLKLVAKALAPNDILEPFGLIKLALLNWWSDNTADKLSDYLVYFKTSVLHVLRLNVAAFPKISAFIKPCRTVDIAV